MIRRLRRVPSGEIKSEGGEIPSDKEKGELEAPPEGTLKKAPDLIVSTGSTLLDLSIFGGRVRGGGLPGGLIVEIFGENSTGKTAVLAEICGCAQAKGGEVKFADPEGRLDRAYAEIYGVNLPEDKYWRPDYVEEVFDDVQEWKPPRKDVISVYGTDSTAALTTALEMGQKGDRMGMKRAKDISAGLRKTGRILAEGGYKLFVCTNQIRTGESGTFTPGGKGIPFWASVRIQMAPEFGKGKKKKITKETSFGSKGKALSKVIGINVIATVIKNSKDDPYRAAPIPIIFGYGIDDIRANLQWLKDVTGDTVYQCGDGKTYQPIDHAITYVEMNNLEDKLKNTVIDTWEEIEGKFNKYRERKPKRR